jgi:hypothetical protein
MPWCLTPVQMGRWLLGFRISWVTPPLACYGNGVTLCQWHCSVTTLPHCFLVQKLMSKWSIVSSQVLQALTLRLKVKHESPLITMHIVSSTNAMTDVPSRSFGSKANRFCQAADKVIILYNCLFPLLNQHSWTIFWYYNDICTRVISVLWMQALGMEEGWWLPSTEHPSGPIGQPMYNLWGWTLIFRTRLSPSESYASWGFLHKYDQANMAEENRSKVIQWLSCSRPLVRLFPWTTM